MASKLKKVNPRPDFIELEHNNNNNSEDSKIELIDHIVANVEID